MLRQIIPLPYSSFGNVGEAKEDDRCIRCERPIPDRSKNQYCSQDCELGNIPTLRFQDKTDQEVYLKERLLSFDH